jgi:hypothetical protein
MAEQAPQPADIFACTRCRKRFRADGFSVKRLGERSKTCLECCARAKVEYARNRCEHGGRRTQCRDCGGAAICEHGRRRTRCRDCGGVGICEHGRQRAQCRDCGGAGICEHGRQRGQCRGCDMDGFIASRLATRMCVVLGAERGERSTVDVLGCTIPEFRAHLEAQFRPGMTWETYGRGDGGCWEIDHVVLLKYGNPSVAEVFTRLHYTNTQPLLRVENAVKGNRIADERRAMELIAALEARVAALEGAN